MNRKVSFRQLLKKTKILTAILVSAIFFLIQLAQAHTITVPTNTYFGFANGCYINFNPTQTFTTIHRINNYWHFNSYAIQVENANMTITKYFTDNTLSFTVNASSGTTSTTRIYAPNKGKPHTITGASSWSYSASTETVTVNVAHSSVAEITVAWIVPESIIIAIRNNYYLVFSLLSIMPVVLAAVILISMVKRRETVELKEILAVIPVFIVLVIAFIVIHYVTVSLIGV